MKTLTGFLWILTLVTPMALLAAPQVEGEVKFSEADLDQMLAPIALYPDTVLSHVLIAATYPLEVVQAARWSRDHPDLKGEEAVDAVENQDWDASVKALAAFPEILERMDEDLDWTERLGDAFLAQEDDVMDSVQGLRKHADQAGNLNSLEHVRVVREREVIYIEPAVSSFIFLPFYDPWFVYGSWWWPDYRPYCWRTWYGHPAAYYGSGFYWGVGFNISPVFYSSSFNWHERRVVIVNHDRGWERHHGEFHSGREVARDRDAQPWQHDYRHRHGVAYRSEQLNREYGYGRERDGGRDQRRSQHESPGNRSEGRETSRPARPSERRENGAPRMHEDTRREKPGETRSESRRNRSSPGADGRNEPRDNRGSERSQESQRDTSRHQEQEASGGERASDRGSSERAPRSGGEREARGNSGQPREGRGHGNRSSSSGR